jgi:hypothetical protein
MRCLAQLPDRRPTAAEVAATLSGHERDLSDRPPTRRRDRRLLLAGAGLLAAAAVTVGVVLALDDGPAPQPRPVKVTAVPHARTADAQARNLSAWLRRYSR